MPQTGTPLFTLTEDNGLTPDTEGFDEIGQFDCGGANHGVYHNDSHYRFHISDTRKELTGVLECSHDFTSGRIRLYGKAPQRFFALNNALMILFAFASAPHATLLVHAAVVRQAGRGYLFLGRSGTGKAPTPAYGSAISQAPISSTTTIPSLSLPTGKPLSMARLGAGKHHVTATKAHR